jgi:subtilisin family serine protease
VACLWQAFPEKTPLEIISAVVRSANNYEHPDNVYGYGIPNMWKAYNLLKKQ